MGLDEFRVLIEDEHSVHLLVGISVFDVEGLLELIESDFFKAGDVYDFIIEIDGLHDSFWSRGEHTTGEGGK